MPKTLVFLFVIFSGCETLHVAERFVWDDVYRVGGQCSPPKLDYEISVDKCLSGSGPGECLHGYYDAREDQAVFVLGEGQHLFESSMPHEEYHAALRCRTGDADPNHLQPGWSVEVPLARRALRLRGY